MFKIERIDAPELAKTRFRLKSANSLDFCSYILTIFGKTWRIKYSSQLNYFYIVSQMKRDRLKLENLSLAFVREMIQSKLGKTLESFERLPCRGAGSDFVIKGRLDGEDVFIKVMLSRMQAAPGTGGAMQNEYEKGLLASEDCPYILRPLHYINMQPCEILILPYIYNIVPLSILIKRDTPMPKGIREQLVILMEHLRAKNLVHRDLGNLSVGNLKGKSSQLFLIDCAFMTTLDQEGKPVPLNIESFIPKDRNSTQRDEVIFENFLCTLDKKIKADKNNSNINEN